MNTKRAIGFLMRAEKQLETVLSSLRWAQFHMDDPSVNAITDTLHANRTKLAQKIKALEKEFRKKAK